MSSFVKLSLLALGQQGLAIQPTHQLSLNWSKLGKSKLARAAQRTVTNDVNDVTNDMNGVTNDMNDNGDNAG